MSLFSGLRGFGDKYRSTMEQLYDPWRDADFSQGRLTFPQFLESGNLLVEKNHCWKWYKPGYTPDPKKKLCDQFLVYDNAVLAKPVEAPDYVEDEHGWSISKDTIKQASERVPAHIVDLDSDNALANDEDMEEIVEDVDDGAAVRPHASASNARTYQIIIAYSARHQTPKMYIQAKEKNQTVDPEDLIKELNPDHTSGLWTATATIDTFPHMEHDVRMVSIHPCNHHKMMVKFVAWEEERASKRREKEINATTDEEAREALQWEEVPESTVKPHQYMFFFLKICQTMLPQIDLDYSGI